MGYIFKYDCALDRRTLLRLSVLYSRIHCSKPRRHCYTVTPVQLQSCSRAVVLRCVAWRGDRSLPRASERSCTLHHPQPLQLFSARGSATANTDSPTPTPRRAHVRVDSPVDTSKVAAHPRVRSSFLAPTTREHNRLESLSCSIATPTSSRGRL